MSSFDQKIAIRCCSFNSCYNNNEPCSFCFDSPVKTFTFHTTREDNQIGYVLAVNGIAQDTIYLRRGQCYCFIFNPGTAQPGTERIIFTSDPHGGSNAIKIQGTPDFLTEKNVVCFRIAHDFPINFFYQSAVTLDIGGKVVVVQD